MSDTIPNGSHRSVLFICKRAFDDPIVDQVSRELDQAIVRATTPADGMDKVRSGDFALILVGYSGDVESMLETVRAVRANERSCRTPVVAVGLPQPLPFAQELLYEAGAIAVLTEPLSPTILRAKARFYIDAFNSQLERQRAEAELGRTRARLERIIEAAELGIWSWHLRADRIEADARMAALFGVPPSRRLDMPLAAYFSAFHPDDVAPTQARLDAAIAGAGIYAATYRIRAADGGWLWIIARGHVEYDDQGAPCEVRGVVMDATRQLDAEQRLRATEERYRTVFDSIDEGLCVVDLIYDDQGRPCDHLYLEANPAFVKHTGLTDAVGRTMRQMVPGHDQHWFDVLGQVAATGQAVRFENQAWGLNRWYDVYATRLGAPGSGRVAVLFTDITERRASEAALRRMAADLSEANRLKTEFLATLAHELRNPLAPIRSGLQFIRRAPGERDAVGRVHDIMERQLDHLVTLVDDLLDVARITRGQVELRRERVDLASVLTAAVETSMPLIEAGRHEFELRLPDETLVLHADPTRLTQVVSNLLNNAARYTPKGGRIALAARREGGQAVVTVSDNGIGIAPEALHDVFRMFTQVGRAQQPGSGGLGIGLSLVRSLVELHGGSVSAASPGTNAGSVFTVRLPLGADSGAGSAASADAGAEERTPQAPSPAAAALERTVLVVDDNRDAAETLAALLNMLGHRACVANEGRQALRMLPGLMPDVVFLDLGMPGMSGFEVAAAIRRDARLAGIRLVALTGWGGEADRGKSRAAGFDEHLTKPATLEAIEDVLNKR